MHHSREKQYIVLKKYKEYAAKAIQPMFGKTLLLNEFTTFRRYCFT